MRDYILKRNGCEIPEEEYSNVDISTIDLIYEMVMNDEEPIGL
jgi:hypothetical protein